MESTQKLPAVRPLDVAPFRNEQNELYFALHDLTQVAPRPIAVSLPGYFVLSHLDGEHTCHDVQAAFLQRFGQVISSDQIEQMIASLDQALLLDNAGFERAYAARRDEYLASEARDNRQRYPAGPELRSEIAQMLAGGSAAAVSDLRGIIAPHLDYVRGRPCYADAYATLARVPPAQRYVVLGANHFGRSSAAVATSKDFQTPLGRVPTDREFIDQLEQRLGQSVCEYQFDHNVEHSVELQVQILQVCHGEMPFSIVPVLCPDPSGPTGTAPHDGRGPDLGDFADALAALLATDDHRTVLIAGADLSHVGQRFGDEEAATAASLEQVGADDQNLLRLLEQRKEETFVDTLRENGNPTRICSAGCIYALLRALPDRQFQVLRYHEATDVASDTHVTCAAAVVGE